MRDSYAEFTLRGAEILAIGTDSTSSFQSHWKKESIPYIGLSDPKASVPRLYRQEVNLFKLGRMPLNCVVDTEGKIRYIHFGSNMKDIPDNETFLRVIDQINASSN
jgi:peroxiredoxin Q/BCP